MSKHPALLRLGGLADRRRRGKNNVYGLTAAGARLTGAVRELIG